MRGGQFSWPLGSCRLAVFEVCAHRAVRPRRLTAAFLHCRCPKGKQKHAREGFDFAVPATFANGFFWAKEVLEAYRTLAPARQRLAGLCFSDEGRPWTILEVQETMQQEMSVFLDNPEDLTTYSWRRLAPTVAQLLGCRPEEMAALGDWQNKSEQPEVGAMAFHYSSAKYAASVKVKSLIWGATAKLTSNLLWEAIPQAELDAARAHGLTEADRLLRQDRQPMWASAHSFQDVKKRLKLSQQFVEAAQQARQEAEAAPAPQMPDQLKGKVLTATLKNGKAICPEFQTDECPNPADSCPFGVHLCAHPTEVRTGMWWQARRRHLQHQASGAGRNGSASGTQAIGHLGAGSRGGEGHIWPEEDRGERCHRRRDGRGDAHSCQESPRPSCTQDSAQGASHCSPQDTSKG